MLLQLFIEYWQKITKQKRTSKFLGDPFSLVSDNRKHFEIMAANPKEKDHFEG
jgi:hypothetical protein